jgi:DNA-binding transcriptional MerR regulator
MIELQQDPAAEVAPLRQQAHSPAPERRPLGNVRMPVMRWATIGDVAKEYAITLRALRFYESKGLLTPLRQGSQRLYSGTDRARIGLILSAKELGFTLAEISGMLAENGTSNELTLKADVLLRQIAFMEKQHSSIEAALAALRMRYYTLTEKP